MAGIENWTDVDYAQAAIDMLPGTVEEIAEFLRVQGIKNLPPGNGPRSRVCPIAKWIGKWQGADVGVAFNTVRIEGILIYLPEAVQEYIIWADSLSNRA